MKTIKLAVLSVCVFAAMIFSTKAADVSVGVTIHVESDFHEPLSPYGRWEVVGDHGRCWIPARVEADWRPYCNGHWVRTDEGWYWDSDEPWAWATYHYGRWDFHAQFGWYWVPQTQWAPAWVSWHHGGGYVSWAPLHPSARITRGVVEIDVRIISTRAYVIVEERHFLAPVRPKTVVVNNTTIINKTVNITNTKIVNNTVINEGPQTAVIEKASGQKVQAVAVRELRVKTEAAPAARQRKAPPTAEKNAVPAQNPSKVEKAAPTSKEPVAPEPTTEKKAAPAQEPSKVEKDKPAHPPAEARPAEVKPATKPEAKPDGKTEQKDERRGKQPEKGDKDENDEHERDGRSKGKQDRNK